MFYYKKTVYLQKLLLLLSLGSLDTWTVKALAHLNNKHPYDFDVDLTPELLNVGIALQSKGLLAAYVAFAMTKHGHL